MNIKVMIKYTKIFSITKTVKTKKIYCVICGKYRKFRNPKISYIFVKILLLPVISSKCENEDEKIFKLKESIEILTILGLVKNIWLR